MSMPRVLSRQVRCKGRRIVCDEASAPFSSLEIVSCHGDSRNQTAAGLLSQGLAASVDILKHKGQISLADKFLEANWRFFPTNNSQLTCTVSTFYWLSQKQLLDASFLLILRIRRFPQAETVQLRSRYQQEGEKEAQEQQTKGFLQSQSLCRSDAVMLSH